MMHALKVLVPVLVAAAGCSSGGGGNGTTGDAATGQDPGGKTYHTAAECESICGEASDACPAKVDLASCRTKCAASATEWVWASKGTAEDLCAVFYLGPREDVPCSTFASLPCVPTGEDVVKDAADVGGDVPPGTRCSDACAAFEGCSGAKIMTCVANCDRTAGEVSWPACVLAASGCGFAGCFDTFCSDGCDLLTRCAGGAASFQECYDGCVLNPGDMLGRTNVACLISAGDCDAGCF